MLVDVRIVVIIHLRLIRLDDTAFALWVCRA